MRFLFAFQNLFILASTCQRFVQIFLIFDADEWNAPAVRVSNWAMGGRGGLQFTQRSLNMTACIRQTSNFGILKLNIDVSLLLGAILLIGMKYEL